MTTISSAPDAAARSAANLKGIAWMVLTGVLFVAFTGIVRHLGSDMSPVQAAFIRYAMGLCILAPVFLRLRATGLFSKRIGLHAFRGLIHGGGVMLWFYAMAHMPIAEVTALGFIVPIFATIGAALFLGERLHARRIGAVLAGFAGAMLILRPGIEVIEPGAIAQIIAAPLFAASFIITKKLTETESNTVIVAYLAVFVTLALALPALAVWRTPTWEELAWLFLAACIATLGHLSLMNGIEKAFGVRIPPAEAVELWNETAIVEALARRRRAGD